MAIQVLGLFSKAGLKAIGEKNPEQIINPKARKASIYGEPRVYFVVVRPVAIALALGANPTSIPIKNINP
jgi:hypothetical protein